MIRRTITLDFFFGDEVQLKTDTEYKRIVTGIILKPKGKMYELACGLETSYHQAVEIEKFPEVQKIKGFRNANNGK